MPGFSFWSQLKRLKVTEIYLLVIIICLFTNNNDNNSLNINIFFK